jgi:hypothetical protein
MNGAGPGAEKETMRYIQIVDCECHIYPHLYEFGRYFSRKPVEAITSPRRKPLKKRNPDTIGALKCQEI